MVAQPHRLLMSVEDYLTLDRISLEVRYEFIDGYAYMMSGGTADHSVISINVTSLLRNLLRGSSCRTFNSDMRVRLADMRYVYPDASVSCDERDRGTIDIVYSPRVAIEVLSPGTEAYDRGRKFGYYRLSPTLQEYVLVDTQQRSVEVYRRARENLWTLYAYGGGEQVQLTSLGISFLVDDLYEGVSLAGENV